MESQTRDNDIMVVLSHFHFFIFVNETNSFYF